MLKVYNTLSRKLEEFKPLHDKQVGFYTCGPTVYDVQHIGNLRAAVNSDVFERVLKYFGYKVKHIVNITDVGHLVSDGDEGEDKMMKGLKREGLDYSAESMLKLSQKYTQIYINDLELLNVTPPKKFTKATEHIKDMIKMVQKLIDKGIVYETSTAFYFDTSKIKNYGELANLQNVKLEEGARIAVDKEKRNPTDFAVWIKAVGDNAKHVMLWDAPFSDVPGFPGWHIECSAMSIKYLGDQLDIHAGGIEHISVHHTNEIAQSEAFTGKQFVKYWLHNEHLILPEGKMSKSEGNSVVLQDIIDKGFDPLALRFLILQVNYRTKLTFSWDSLADAQKGYHNLISKFISFGKKTGKVNSDYKERFIEAISDDFNTAKGLAVLFEILKDNAISDEDKRATVLDFDNVLGLNLKDVKIKEIKIPKEIIKLADKRLKAKKEKNYEEADKLRDEIISKGWEVKDTSDGYELNLTSLE